MHDLLGEGHHRLLAMLLARVEAVTAGESGVPRVVLIEGASGMGKSRIVRELYQVMRNRYDADGYWPQLDEHGGNASRSRDPLPGRKVIGPSVDDFLWPANALPGFGWWQFHCERMYAGQFMNSVTQIRPEVDAHLVPVALAWSYAASVGDKWTAKRAAVTARVRQVLAEGGVEAASQLLTGLGYTVPGLGLAASWLLDGYHATRERHARRGDLRQDLNLGDRVRKQQSSSGAQLASVILGVAHAKVPAVVVVEDAHLMDAAMAEMLDRLAVADVAHPVVVVATAWPESSDSPAYTRWRDAAIAERRVEIVGVPELGIADLIEIVRAYAPATGFNVARAAAVTYANPLALEATLGSRMLQRAIADNRGAVPESALSSYPVGLGDVYRDRFRELPDETQLALAVAGGALPDSGGGGVVPFVQSVALEAVERCGVAALPIDSLKAGFSQAFDEHVWLIRSGKIDRFREPLQAEIAREQLQRDVLTTSEFEGFRDAVFDVLTERIDAVRGSGYRLADSDETRALSAWLLVMADDYEVRGAAVAAASTVCKALGSAYLYAEAAELAQSVLDAADLDDRDHPDVLELRHYLGYWLTRGGDFERAQAVFEPLIADETRVLGAEAPLTLRTTLNQIHCIAELHGAKQAQLRLEVLLAACIRVLGPENDETMTVRHNLAYWRSMAGHPSEAIDEMWLVLADRERLLGTDAQPTMTTRHTLGWLLAGEKRWHEAISVLEHALAGRISVLGPTAPDTLQTWQLLGNVLRQAGEYRRAAGVLAEVVKHSNQRNGPVHPDTLDSRWLLADTLRKAGELDEAITAYTSLLEDTSRTDGPDHPETLRIRNNLAFAVGCAGRVDEALNALRLLLVDQIAALGADDPQTSLTRHNIGYFLHERGQFTDAVAEFTKAFEQRLRNLGPDSPDTVATRESFGNTLLKVGRTQDAIAHLREVVSFRLRHHEIDHPDALASRTVLAEALHQAGQLDEASAMYPTLIEDTGRVLGAEDPVTMRSRHNFAVALVGRHRHDEALEIYQALLSDQIRAFGPDHPDTLTSRHNIVHALTVANRFEEAITAAESVLQDRQRVLGPYHSDTCETRTLLAHNQYRARRFSDAERTYAEQLAINLHTLGPDHPDTHQTRHSLAHCVLESGRASDATPLFRTLLDHRIHHLGGDHPDTWRAERELASCLDDEGSHDEALAVYRRLLGRYEAAGQGDDDAAWAIRHDIAYVTARTGALESAIAAYREVLAVQQRVHADSPGAMLTRLNLSRCLLQAGRREEAIATARSLARDTTATLGVDHPLTSTSAALLDELLQTQAGD